MSWHAQTTLTEKTKKMGAAIAFILIVSHVCMCMYTAFILKLMISACMCTCICSARARACACACAPGRTDTTTPPCSTSLRSDQHPDAPGAGPCHLQPLHGDRMQHPRYAHSRLHVAHSWHTLTPPRGTLSRLHAAHSHASTWHTLTLSRLHVAQPLHGGRLHHPWCA